MKEAILTVIKEGETVKTCPIQGEVLLGREEGCTIRLPDRAISRHHALFRTVGDHIQVEKKSDFAPLIVNGADCTRAILKEGDVVAVGPYLIRLSLPEKPAIHQSAPQNVLSSPPSTPSDQPQDLAATSAAIADPLNILDPLESPAAQSDLGSSNEANVGDSELGSPQINLDEVPSPDGFEPPNDLAENNAPASEEPSAPSIAIDENANTKVIPAAKVDVKLIFKPGTANVTEFDLNQDEVFIGRGKNCAIVLADKKSSRRNSVIRRVGLNFVIKDLESANGTFVNGVRVQEQELSGDDLIKIGNVEFQFKALSTDYAAKVKEIEALPPIPDLADPDSMGLAQAAQEISPDQALVQGVDPAQAPMLPLTGGLPQNPGIQLDVNSINNIPGIGGDAQKSKKKGTLLEKYRALPKRTQYIVLVAIIAFLYWFMDDEEPPSQAKKAPPSKKPAAVAANKGPVTYDQLLPEQKRFVEAQHSLAFDYYKNKEYDKALFEIAKIFTLVQDYKDSREIERYAKEGKRKLEALEEERRKKEEEAQLKIKIDELVNEAGARMKKKQYEQAKEIFSQILALDPDNIPVANWQKEIETYEEEIRLKRQQKQVEEAINKRAWDVYREASNLKKEGKYHTAINVFQQAIDVGASDKRVIFLSKKMIGVCKATIRNLRDPVLQEAKQAEDAGDLPKAFALYKKATKIDPPHPAGYAGMERIKGVLHDRAKVIYTEAVLAESYSDFVNAKKLFQQCLEAAPPDDIYHERAQRKLGHYFRKDDAPPQ